MNARLTREQRDETQMTALAAAQIERYERQAERREARILLAGILAAHAIAYTLTIWLVAVLAVAWFQTHDDRFVWPIVLIVGGTVYAIARTFVSSEVPQ